MIGYRRVRRAEVGSFADAEAGPIRIEISITEHERRDRVFEFPKIW